MNGPGPGGGHQGMSASVRQAADADALMIT
jgi:hypothetical protein